MKNAWLSALKLAREKGVGCRYAGRWRLLDKHGSPVLRGISKKSASGAAAIGWYFGLRNAEPDERTIVLAEVGNDGDLRPVNRIDDKVRAIKADGRFDTIVVVDDANRHSAQAALKGDDDAKIAVLSVEPKPRKLESLVEVYSEALRERSLTKRFSYRKILNIILFSILTIAILSSTIYMQYFASVISARIDSHYPNNPSSPIEVRVGDSTTISVTFTNTGNTDWQFIAGATIIDSNFVMVGNYEKKLGTALQPGSQTTVEWNHTVHAAGDYWIQFGLWKAEPFIKENLLVKKPSPSQRLITSYDE